MKKECAVCKKAPVIYARVSNGSKTSNAYLCENCTKLVSNKFHVEVLGSLISSYKTGDILDDKGCVRATKDTINESKTSLSQVHSTSQNKNSGIIENSKTNEKSEKVWKHAFIILLSLQIVIALAVFIPKILSGAHGEGTTNPYDQTTGSELILNDGSVSETNNNTDENAEFLNTDSSIKVNVSDSIYNAEIDRTEHEEKGGAASEEQTQRVKDFISMAKEFSRGVTIDSAERIEDAKLAYDLLSEKEKNDVVEYYKEVEAAAFQLNKLKNEESAKRVIDRINSIGVISEYSDELLIELQSIMTEYNTLSGDAKPLVINIDDLKTAEETLKYYKSIEDTKKEQERQWALSQILAKFNIKEDKVDKLTWYVPSARPAYINLRSYVIPYLGIKNNKAILRIIWNYTGDDWIFWDNIKIVTDNETYAVNAGYSTVTDNNADTVWEYYDEYITNDLRIDNYKLSMLDDMANSYETIVRFRGRDFYYDLVLPQSDKDMIKDVINLYKLLTNQ